jgi:hypothetical protein
VKSKRNIKLSVFVGLSLYNENKSVIFGITEGDNDRYAYLLDKAANLIIIHFHSLYLKKVLPGNIFFRCADARQI